MGIIINHEIRIPGFFGASITGKKAAFGQCPHPSPFCWGCVPSARVYELRVKWHQRIHTMSRGGTQCTFPPEAVRIIGGWMWHNTGNAAGSEHFRFWDPEDEAIPFGCQQADTPAKTDIGYTDPTHPSGWLPPKKCKARDLKCIDSKPTHFLSVSSYIYI